MDFKAALQTFAEAWAAASLRTVPSVHDQLGQDSLGQYSQNGHGCHNRDTPKDIPKDRQNVDSETSDRRNLVQTCVSHDGPVVNSINSTHVHSVQVHKYIRTEVHSVQVNKYISTQLHSVQEDNLS